MKRIIASVIAVFISCLFSINCFAAEYSEELKSSVYGKYNYYSNEGIYTTTADNGEYSLTTENGVLISVASLNSDYVLVVHQISSENKDFYDWFYNQIDNLEKNAVPYDIYFLNGDGERVELSSEDTIKIQASNSSQHISKLSYDGKIYDVSYSNSNGYLIFNADSTDGYYFVSEHREIHSPATGDYSRIEIWSSLMFLCALNIIIMIILNKLKKKNQ